MMDRSKQSLDVEDLENRVAPTLVMAPAPVPSPVPSGGGGTGSDPEVYPPAPQGHHGHGWLKKSTLFSPAKG